MGSKEACSQVMKWINAGLPPIRVAVNIAKQFESDTIISTVKRTLQEENLAPELLQELELTERITMKDIHFVTKTLKQLDDLGVKISLDDFGKDISLNYLKLPD
ncbi:EAL domain-containing protein [Anaerobacillus sp. HL2]|nr:EAL domain-containing protein [Anaerobacillus sp. HL2]